MDRTQDEVVKELERAGFRYRNTLSFGDVVLVKKSGPVTEFAQVDGDGLVNGDDLESFLKQTLNLKAAADLPLVDSIRPGDRVTIITPHGSKLTGRAVMKGPAGWVLNLGGRYGTPGIATDENTIEVRKSRSGGMENTMDRTTLASEILKIAKSMVAMDFPTQDAFDKYMKDHPDADKSNHRVVETKKEAPAKKSKPLSRDEEDQVSDVMRSHLHNTKRVVTKETMHSLLNNRMRGNRKLTDEQFGQVWDSMVKDEYLKKTDGGYRWNDEGEFSSK